MYHYSNFVENDIRLEISNPVYGYRKNPSSAMHIQSGYAKLAHYEDMVKMAKGYKLAILQLVQMLFDNERSYRSVSWLYNIKTHLGGSQ